MDHEHDPVYEVARDKLTEAVREFVKETHVENCLLLGSTLVYETTMFDENGHQNYATGHVILDPSSMAHGLGLVTAAKDRLSAYINRQEEED